MLSAIHDLTLKVCEPVPAMFMIWFGPALNLAIITSSLLVLALVVAIKSAVFSYIARIGWWQGFSVMVTANLFSTLPGLLIGIALGAMSGLFFFGFGILWVCALLVGRWVYPALRQTSWAWLKPSVFVGITLCLSFFSYALVMIGPALASLDNLTSYWIVKILGLFFGLLASLALTVGWEAGVVLKMSRRQPDLERLLRAVIMSNVITLLLVFLVGAIIAIPQRNRNHRWLLGG